jgi:metal-sulfur cluster biosynthetic enzyme
LPVCAAFHPPKMLSIVYLGGGPALRANRGTTEAGMADFLSEVTDALHDVYDPCCREKGISVVDMGLIHSATRDDAGRARVELMLTSGWCPFAAKLLAEVGDRVRSMPGVGDADVDIVWDQPWTTDRLSPEATRKLRFLPPPGQVRDRDAYVAAHRRPATQEQEENQ